MFQWYVINTYSGHENKVKANLEHRIESMNQQPRFRRVVVPTEQVIETKDGQKVQTEKRVLPGYVLVNMDMNDDAWTVVKNTPGVTGFVGAGNKPLPLSQGEVDRILHTGAGTAAAVARAGRVQLGESVKVTSGPLSDFDGEIVDVNADQQKLKVLVDIFERQVRSSSASTRSRSSTRQERWRRRFSPSSSSRSPAARPTRRRRSALRSASTASTSWSSARRSTPRRRRPERPHHPGRDHGLRGPLLHLHHEDAARGRPDQGGAAPREGLGEPNRDKVGTLTRAQVRQIAETKLEDLNARDVEQAMKVIAGTARSMGVEVEA